MVLVHTHCVTLVNKEFIRIMMKGFTGVCKQLVFKTKETKFASYLWNV